ncbi:MAG: serine/threonine protein kinase, partial [Planctomycetaceae bacterium]|nr:serine/threonine protein kinase [Planctomycetaceae bacterium]
MTAGGESWIGMAEKLKGGSEDDPKLAAALERLKADDGSGGEPSEAADPQRTLDFLQPADDPKLLGKLGQHEISEVVGWGGMGVVLKAYDPSLHRVVAVKVLASHLAHHAVARKRFIREAQAAAAVCHDNVVTIHAIDEAGSGDPRQAQLPKIIMQFVAGGSLQERIDQEGPLELKEILRIAMQTAAGLAAAHAQGVVHRDVKPANILLENGVQRVKLTDFGLARVMDDASLTLSGVIAGTPQYMAPEQAWGRDVDARADLFSLGAVMYAMCAGHSPFRARTTMAVLKRVCEDAPRPLRAINPDVPAWLVAIIEKLLAKNPDDRFQSASEVSDLLSRWLAHVQQPNVAPSPKLVAPVAGRAGIAALPSDVADVTADAALALSELQRRPEELQYRLQLLRRVFYVVAGVAIPVVLFFLTNLPNRSWTPAEAFRYSSGILVAAVGFLFLMGIVGRWLSVGESEQLNARRRSRGTSSHGGGEESGDPRTAR